MENISENKIIISGNDIVIDQQLYSGRAKDLPDPVETAIRFGRGWDSVRARVRGDAVVAGEVDSTLGDPLHPDGQQVSYDLKLITSSYNLRSVLLYSASASFGFGVFSGQVDVNFLKQQEFSELNQYLLAQVRVLNKKTTLKRLEMIDRASKTFRKSLTRGYEGFGNGFLATVQYGGVLYILLEIKANSYSEKQQLSSKVNAALKAYTVSGKLEQSFEILKQVQQVNLKLFRAGGHGDLPVAGFLQAIEYARVFPDKVNPKKGNPYPINASILDYNTTEQMPIPGNGEFLNKAIETLEKLAKAVEDLIDVRAKLESVIKFPYAYENLSPSEAQQWINVANEQISSITDLAKQIEDDPLNAEEWVNDYPPIPLPVLKEELLDVLSLPTSGGYIPHKLSPYNGRIVMHPVDNPVSQYKPPIATPEGLRCISIRTDVQPGEALFHSTAPRNTGVSYVCWWPVGSLPQPVLSNPLKVVAADGSLISITLKYRDGGWKFSILYDV